jgi:hypothetical protein
VHGSAAERAGAGAGDSELPPPQAVISEDAPTAATPIKLNFLRKSLRFREFSILEQFLINNRQNQ